MGIIRCFFLMKLDELLKYFPFMESIHVFVKHYCCLNYITLYPPIGMRRRPRGPRGLPAPNEGVLGEVLRGTLGGA